MATTITSILNISFLFFLVSFQNCYCIYDYSSALSKSLMYFEASRSGRLPSTNRVLWRDNSALYDGNSQGVDLVGGYYVNGGNVKYGLPMAYAVTMLSWSTIEFGNNMETAGELPNALNAIKWGTDYLIKCHTAPNVFYGQVGDEWSDHACWERPEDMDTPRKVYKFDQNHPASDLAGETAAALAAASIAFRARGESYCAQLLNHAKQENVYVSTTTIDNMTEALQLFDFATNYQGRYQDTIPDINQSYGSNEYEDEQIWAALWLYEATYDTKYMDYINKVFTTAAIIHPFSWDNKYPGIFILVGKLLLKGKLQNVSNFRVLGSFGVNFVCNCLGSGPTNWLKTKGGLLYWKESSNNLESVTSAAFLVAVYAQSLLSSGQTLNCFKYHITYTPTDLLKFVRSQVDYILGSNPNKMSYMVGFGQTYPKQVFHKGASIVSVKFNRTKIGCQDGWDLWEKIDSPNPNVLEGAVVAGPDSDDNFNDIRYFRNQTEPTLTTIAPFVGLLAFLS